MKSRMFQVLLIILAVCLLAQAGHAQLKLQSNIPFNFSAGGKEFPAGSCIFERPERSGGALTIKVKCGATFAALGALPITEPGLTFQAMKNEISFHRYGDRYFLYEVWIRSIGGQIYQSAQEKEAAKDGEGTVVHLKMKSS